MKYLLYIVVFFLFVQNVGATDNWKDYITPDTLKSPEGKQLTAKQQRRLANVQVGTDYSLSQTKRKADELFNHVGYMAAANRYHKLDEIEKNEFVQSKMANSYRLNGDYKNAEYWYAQCINETPYVEDYLYYAQVLLINGKCEDAVRWNKEYLAKTMDTDRDIITDCDHLKAITTHKAVEVRNLLTLNTSDLDFSAIPYQNGLVFTSNRGINRLTKKLDRWTKQSFTDLFFAEMNNGTVTSIQPFSESINNVLHDGTATFTEAGTEMIFSRSDNEGQNTNNIKELQLYASSFRDGVWTAARKLDFCNSEFTYCHATLSPDGKKLYFASNQDKGSYGGMDIWVSSKKLDNTWTMPMNLGPNVNTSGNEIFPYFANDQTLYFSSDGHQGLGGLDIFNVAQSVDNDDRSWNNRSNLGKPFNSQKDDFGFYANRKKNSGYFSSNRDGGQGGDDIYSWSGLMNNGEVTRQLVIIDKKTKKRLVDAQVELSNDKDSESKVVKTGKTGALSYSVNSNNDYTFKVMNKGYLPYTFTVSGDELVATDKKVIPLTKINKVNTSGTIFNEKYNKPLANAKVVILDRCSGKTTQVYSDAAGSFNFEAECGCEYEIRGTKDSFTEGVRTVSITDADCERFVKGASVEVILGLQFIEPVRRVEPMPRRSYATLSDRRSSGLNTYFLGSEELHFEEGQIIRLSNLYYDLDKFYIRTDAGQELNHVYELLRAYPTMKIALMSHTDARGSDRYNTRLSQKRAFSARDYLIAKGISPDRVSSVGLGETMLVNECSDGVNCSEEEHQLNRRTEIKITELREPGVKVIRR